jgi:GNAT superfamily N-acetyltransferase
VPHPIDRAVAVWRAMAEADLAEVVAIAAAIHVAHPERDAVFAERLFLYPRGCLILMQDGAVLGYAIAHPWLISAPPALDTLLGALPARPDCLYLHDVALRPAGRGHGATARLLARLDDLARAAGLARLALVAIPGTDRVWRRLGFLPRARADDATRGDGGYGAGAALMERPVHV